MSSWTDYATKYYKDKLKTNPNYKFKDALKDAAKARKSEKKGGDMAKSSKKKSKKSVTQKKRRR